MVVYDVRIPLTVVYRHDFLGRSSGHGSFMLWTHHMKDIAVDEVFRPLGAPEGVYYEFGQYESVSSVGLTLIHSHRQH